MPLEQTVKCQLDASGGQCFMCYVFRRPGRGAVVPHTEVQSEKEVPVLPGRVPTRLLVVATRKIHQKYGDVLNIGIISDEYKSTRYHFDILFKEHSLAPHFWEQQIGFLYSRIGTLMSSLGVLVPAGSTCCKTCGCTRLPLSTSRIWIIPCGWITPRRRLAG